MESPLDISNELRIVARICRKLSPEELAFFVQHCDNHSAHLLSELLYNCIFNEDIYKLISKRKRFGDIKEQLSENKKDILKILKLDAPIDKRVKLMRKQVGSGLFSALIGILVSVVPSLLR